MEVVRMLVATHDLLVGCSTRIVPHVSIADVMTRLVASTIGKLPVKSASCILSFDDPWKLPPEWENCRRKKRRAGVGIVEIPPSKFDFAIHDLGALGPGLEMVQIYGFGGRSRRWPDDCSWILSVFRATQLDLADTTVRVTAIVRLDHLEPLKPYERIRFLESILNTMVSAGTLRSGCIDFCGVAEVSDGLFYTANQRGGTLSREYDKWISDQLFASPSIYGIYWGTLFPAAIVDLIGGKSVLEAGLALYRIGPGCEVRLLLTELDDGSCLVKLSPVMSNCVMDISGSVNIMWRVCMVTVAWLETLRAEVSKRRLGRAPE